MKHFYFLLGLLVIIALLTFLITPAFLPESKQVKVVDTIHGPKNLVFDNFNNLKKQVENNTFLEQDSALGKLFFSPYIGENANFKWNSIDNKIGSGDILITYSKADSIATLVTLNDFKTSYIDSFKFEELSPNDTKVTWYRHGETLSYFQRLFLFLNKAKDFQEIQTSLSNVKEKIEANKYANAEPDREGKIKKEYIEGMKLLVVENPIENMTSSKITSARNASIPYLESYIVKNLKLSPQQYSHPIAYIEKWDTLHQSTLIDFGFTMKADMGQRPEKTKLKAIPATNVYSYVLKGNYRQIDSMKTTLNRFIKQAHAMPGKYFWIEELSSNAQHDTMLLKAYQSVESN